MILKIAQLGQPVLRERAREISTEEITTPEFQTFLSDMRETLEAQRGAGLAGPQVFRHKRVFLGAILLSAPEDEPRGVEVFINPKFTAASEETGFSWEGCLSFPELMVLVERAEAVRIEYLNAAGETRTLELSGFPARIVQHEYDHLEGILTIDRAPSTKYIVKASEIEAVLAAEQSETTEKAC
jgi:peptide deformylase